MKKGDRVYINWPTGKGGPYEVIVKNQYGYRLKIEHNGTEEMILDTSWCEPAEPEIEEGRLVSAKMYFDDGPSDIIYCKYHKHIPIANAYRIQPVHRRWDELKEHEQIAVTKILSRWHAGKISDEDVYSELLKIQSGEEHP